MEKIARHRWLIPALLSLAALIALILRTASLRNFINPEGGFFFYGIDPYDHLRRIALGVHSFPSVPSFDYYAGYPKGTGQIWSPLYDYILSTISLLFGGSRATIETVGFFTNPFFAAVSVVLIFFVAKRTFASYAAGIAAAFFLAASPGHTAYSLAAKLDHHVLEPLAVLLLFSVPFFEKSGRLSLKEKFVAALFIVLTIFMWRGSTIYWGMTFFSAFLRSFIAKNKKLSLDYSVVFACASILIAAVCIADPWGAAGGVSFGIISWFHVIVLTLFSVVLLLFSISRTCMMFYSSLGAIAVISALSLFFWAPAKSFLSEMALGISFVRGGGDPWIESIRELKGTFSDYSFLYTASFLTVTWFAAPFAIVAALRRWKQKGKTDEMLLSFVSWSPLLLLGFLIRHTHVAGTISSLAGAYLFSLCWERYSGIKQRAAAGAITVLLLMTSYPHYKSSLAFQPTFLVKHGLLGKGGALPWIRDNTPKTSYYFDPQGFPEYGILAAWYLGARIYHVAERPAMATAFGWETHGFYEHCAFMTTERPEVADSILKKNRIRYVLIDTFENYLKHAFEIAADGRKKGKLERGAVDVYRPELTMFYRLKYNDGVSYDTPERHVPALGNLRLLFESSLAAKTRDPKLTVSYYKVFEAVPGARIVGKGKPESRVHIRMPLLTSRNRLMYFYDVTAADRDGNFSFHVPYSTEGKQGDTVPLGKYAISGGGIKGSEITIRESDIIEGRTINLRP